VLLIRKNLQIVCRVTFKIRKVLIIFNLNSPHFGLLFIQLHHNSLYLLIFGINGQRILNYILNTLNDKIKLRVIQALSLRQVPQLANRRLRKMFFIILVEVLNVCILQKLKLIQHLGHHQ
jgi:hypothetical protein